jgi:hypothetical protein
MGKSSHPPQSAKNTTASNAGSWAPFESEPPQEVAYATIHAHTLNYTFGFLNALENIASYIVPVSATFLLRKPEDPLEKYN